MEAVPERGVPCERVEAAKAHLGRADALLVGSSPMVYSGCRSAEFAAAACKPFATANPGRTRADVLLTLKFEPGCEEELWSLM